MKIKSGYMLREIAGNFMVLPLGARVAEFSGVITLNSTGAFLWSNLENEATEQELLERMTAEYDIDGDTARADIKEFIETLKEKNLLDQNL